MTVWVICRLGQGGEGIWFLRRVSADMFWTTQPENGLQFKTKEGATAFLTGLVIGDVPATWGVVTPPYVSQVEVERPKVRHRSARRSAKT